MAPQKDNPITEELNRIYSEEDSRLDPVVQQLMLLSLPIEDWEDEQGESPDLLNKQP